MELLSNEVTLTIVNKIFDNQIENAYEAMVHLNSNLDPAEYKIQHSAIAYDIKRLRHIKYEINKLVGETIDG